MAPDLAKELADPSDCLYRETLAEMVRSDASEFKTPPRALEIIASLRQRLAIHDRPGDSQLFALACELEFWLEVTF